jgi:hypothetical protein
MTGVQEKSTTRRRRRGRAESSNGQRSAPARSNRRRQPAEQVLAELEPMISALIKENRELHRRIDKLSSVLLGMLLFVLLIMSNTIFMTWPLNNTRGSLFLAILAHSAIDSTSVFFVSLFPQIAQASANSAAAGATANRSALLTLTITWAVIAALLIGWTKGRLSYKPPIANEAQIPLAQPSAAGAGPITLKVNACQSAVYGWHRILYSDAVRQYEPA